MTELVNESHAKVLVCDRVAGELMERLTSEGCSVDYMPEISKPQLVEEIPGYDIIVVRSRTKVTGDVLQYAKRLKVIARAGIGTDNIDLDAARSLGIEVITAAGSSTQSVVELNLLLCLDMARRASFLNRKLRNGTFMKLKGREVSGSTCGIIGFGRIGRETAKVLSSLGANIVAYDIARDDSSMSEVGGRYLELNQLLSTSDFIFTCVTLSGNSRALIGKEEIGMMKPGIMIINTSRAEVYDGKELLNAVKDGRIGGYASDVMWNEPPSDDFEKELISLDNVLITPHIGAQTDEGQRRVAVTIAENISRAIRGGI